MKDKFCIIGIVFGLICFIGVFVSFHTGTPNRIWIVGSMLVSVVSFNEYHKNKEKK